MLRRLLRKLSEVMHHSYREQLEREMMVPIEKAREAEWATFLDRCKSDD